MLCYDPVTCQIIAMQRSVMENEWVVYGVVKVRVHHLIPPGWLAVKWYLRLHNWADGIFCDQWKGVALVPVCAGHWAFLSSCLKPLSVLHCRLLEFKVLSLPVLCPLYLEQEGTYLIMQITESSFRQEKTESSFFLVRVMVGTSFMPALIKL